MMKGVVGLFSDLRLDLPSSGEKLGTGVNDRSQTRGASGCFRNRPCVRLCDAELSEEEEPTTRDEGERGVWRFGGIRSGFEFVGDSHSNLPQRLAGRKPVGQKVIEQRGEEILALDAQPC